MEFFHDNDYIFIFEKEKRIEGKDFSSSVDDYISHNDFFHLEFIFLRYGVDKSLLKQNFKISIKAVKESYKKISPYR